MKRELNSAREQDIRNVLRIHLQSLMTEGQDKVFEEMCLCDRSARADMVMANTFLHGYEIKSDADSTVRLPGQIVYYDQVFKYNTVVVAPRHEEDAVGLLPPWWGVMMVVKPRRKSEWALRTVRRPKVNPSRDNYSVAMLLWRSEALDLAEEFGVATGVKSKPISEILERLASVDVDQLSRGVCRKIKQRADRQFASLQRLNDGRSRPVSKSLHYRAPKFLQHIEQ